MTTCVASAQENEWSHFLLSRGIYCRFLGKSLVVRPLLSARFTGSACDGLRRLAQNAGFATLDPAFLRESSCSSYEQLVWCACSAFLTEVVCFTHNKPNFVLRKSLYLWIQNQSGFWDPTILYFDKWGLSERSSSSEISRQEENFVCHLQNFCPRYGMLSISRSYFLFCVTFSLNLKQYFVRKFDRDFVYAFSKSATTKLT
jgi:hypothetical protein